MDPATEGGFAETLVPICVYAFLAVMAVVILIGVIRQRRGPKRLHELAARLAAKHGGRVVPGLYGRPTVRIVRGAIEARIEWWRGMFGKGRKGPQTWVTMGPADVHAAAVYPLFLVVGRHRGGYTTTLDLAHADVKLGDSETDRVLRIHANDPHEVTAFFNPTARAAMLQRPDWETTAFRDGWTDDVEGPTVTLLRVTIPGHVYDETHLEEAIALLESLARRG
jgi:hypothetical protein